MYCIDWNDDDPFEITGDINDDNYTRMEIIIAPCHYLHTMNGYDKDEISPECIADLEE